MAKHGITGIPIQEASQEMLVNEHGAKEWEVNTLEDFNRLLCFGKKCQVDPLSWNDEWVILSVPDLMVENLGEEAFKVIKEMSSSHRIPSMDGLIAAYAYIASQTRNRDLKMKAIKELPNICKIPTYLFLFIHYTEKFSNAILSSSGWGRAKRQAIASWYNHFAGRPLELAMYVTKYQKRHHWSHKDVLRLSHLKPENKNIEMILNYVMKGLDETKEKYPESERDSTQRSIIDYLEAVEMVKRSKFQHENDEEKVVEAIAKHKLVREHIPPQTGLLKSRNVWKALLPGMPIEAFLRNLCKLAEFGLLSGEGSFIVTEKLSDEVIQNSKIHPYRILLASKVFNLKMANHSNRSIVALIPDITQALDKAFYAAFKGVAPSKKSYCVAVDVSESMAGPVHGCRKLSAIEASAALAMTTKRVEDSCDVVAFAEMLTEINIGNGESLDEVISKFRCHLGNHSDCSKPIQWALKNNKFFDFFIIYTRCEQGNPNAIAAAKLVDYRRAVNPLASVIVCSMTDKKATIANPDDAGMLDIAGFDSSIPDMINDFVKLQSRYS